MVPLRNPLRRTARQAQVQRWTSRRHASPRLYTSRPLHEVGKFEHGDVCRTHRQSVAEPPLGTPAQQSGQPKRATDGRPSRPSHDSATLARIRPANAPLRQNESAPKTVRLRSLDRRAVRRSSQAPKRSRIGPVVERYGHSQISDRVHPTRRPTLPIPAAAAHRISRVGFEHVSSQSCASSLPGRSQSQSLGFVRPPVRDDHLGAAERWITRRRRLERSRPATRLPFYFRNRSPIRQRCSRTERDEDHEARPRRPLLRTLGR